MTTADRRASERELSPLLDYYRLARRAACGPDRDRDELWDPYRQAPPLYAYVAALITAGMAACTREHRYVRLRRSVAALWTSTTVSPP